MDPDAVLGHRFPESTFEYSERDAALYALGVGACTETAVHSAGTREQGEPAGANEKCDPRELGFAAPRILCADFQVLPTFAVIFPASLVDQILSLQSLKFDPALLLHGEHALHLFTPSLPPQAKVVSSTCISGLQDKGKSAVLEVQTESRDGESKAPLALNSAVCVLRGAGGFHRTRTHAQGNLHRSSWHSGSPLPLTTKAPPQAPTYSVSQTIAPSQALVYRLSGDYNPLHADPPFAADAGFPQPILHGLCTLGYATRAVLLCAGKSTGEAGSSEMSLRRLRCRFLSHVFPGETLHTDIWVQEQPGGSTLRVPVLTSVMRGGKRQPVLSATLELASANDQSLWSIPGRSAL